MVILLEGLDASGKRTQAELLRNLMRGQGVKTEIVSLPCDSEPWGKVVRAHLGGRLSRSLSPMEAAFAFALDRLALVGVCQEMMAEEINLIFDRSHLSNAYNLARLFLEKRQSTYTYFSKERHLPYLLGVMLRMDQFFREEISNKALARIFYDSPPVVTDGLLRERQRLEGRRIDLHERNLKLQREAYRVYQWTMDYLSQQGEEWIKIPMREKQSVFSADKDWRVRDRLDIAQATFLVLRQRGFPFSYDPEMAQRDYQAEGYLGFEARVGKKLKLVAEGGGYFLPPEHLSEMKEQVLLESGLAESFIEVHGKSFGEVFVTREGVQELRQELLVSRRGDKERL